MTDLQICLAVSDGASPLVMMLLAALVCAIWAVLYLLPFGHTHSSDTPEQSDRPQPDHVNWVMSPLRIAVGTGALWLVAIAAETMIILATDWPIWVIVAIGGICIEVIMLLYALECRTVSRRAGWAICAMRVALVLGVIIMLAQPTWSAELDEEYRPGVAVLIDNSASMHLPEIQMTPARKARLAETFSLADRPVHLDVLETDLRTLGDDLEMWRRTLAEMGSATPKERGTDLAAKRHSIHKGANDWIDKIAAHAKETASPNIAKLKLPTEAISELGRVRTGLTKRISTGLKSIADMTDISDPVKLALSYDKLKASITDTAAGVVDTSAMLGPLATQADEAFYTTLPKKTRDELDTLSARTRFQLAYDVLLHKGSSGKDTNILDRLREKFAVSLYHFASKPHELDVRKFAETTLAPRTQPARQTTTMPARLPNELQLTDMSAALAEMLGLADENRLAGVIVLSDARHTASGHPESYARNLGQAGAPIYPIVIGSDKPPPDAAIASVNSPEVISPGDELLIDASCKLDGMEGKTVHMVLTDGDREVDEKTVTVGEFAQLRKRVQMSDKPTTPGLHLYTLRIDPIPGEIDAGNNDFSFSVNVTDGDTNLLIIENRPRWEYRYVKNLFLGRDDSVKLQHVLLQPDHITGEPDRPTIHASATRPKAASEATALPKNKEEWLKFDVVILGDLPPSVLDEETLEILKALVDDRGGTLICIAGRGYMPHAYGRTVLAELLPVRFIPGVAEKMPEDVFKIALTPEGKNHIITRQDTDPETNAKIWNSLPKIYWRRPIIDSKPGAAVLAYARADGEPTMEDAVSTAERTLQMAKIIKYQRSRALVSAHTVGTGSVMFVGFDRTWRMRYRVGDTYHHKFWGQVLRWATSDRLRSGTNRVKLGADRSRYGSQSPVRIRANIINKDLAPVKDADATIAVYCNEKLVLRRELLGEKGSPGRYSADLGKLPGGAYRVVLGGNTVTKILAEEGQADSVSTEFSVDSTLSAEQVELTADRGMARRLASKSGGRVFEANEVKKILRLLAAKTDEKELPAQFPLWDSWWLLIALLMLAGGEWFTRKRAGLT
ncbi:MAG: hypothetical protein QGH60_09525 [Phycisphaerae bacterium]|jgi:hypothetical protein|nr:hypothetical protein [Phycisphaerae bacterium]